jgi:hypothetical protein
VIKDSVVIKEFIVITTESLITRGGRGKAGRGVGGRRRRFGLGLGAHLQ